MIRDSMECLGGRPVSEFVFHARYPIKPGLYSSHQQLLRLLGQGGGRSLLDVGCAQGAVASGLQKQGWSVVGVEPDPFDADEARKLGFPVITGYMEDVLEAAVDRYDVVLFADVLEHMACPEDALRDARRLLKPDGFVVASIPNVAHLAVRLQLLMGSFTYTDRGPLDRTHLRFYTRKTVEKLFTESGYEVLSRQVTPAPLEVAANAVGLKETPRMLDEINRLSALTWPAGLAYQFLLLAQPVR